MYSQKLTIVRSLRAIQVTKIDFLDGDLFLVVKKLTNFKLLSLNLSMLHIKYSI